MRIHHIGYLVKKLDEARQVFASLGFCEQAPVCHDQSRKIDILFLEKDGYSIELISPTGPDSVVAGLIKRYQNSPYHICYSSESFDTDVSELRKQGFTPLGNAAPAPAIANKNVVFLFHAHIGLIEVYDAASWHTKDEYLIAHRMKQ